ncbi:peptidyl-alpha-hydroxyglycine alpha-amidating lyase family protein [Chloroflexota bacterium]
MRLGSGDFVYERVEEWLKLPEYFTLGQGVPTPVDVAVDSKDRVFLLSSGNHQVLILDRDSNFVSCWGEGHFRNTHDLTIGPDDSLYIVDRQAHVVEKYTPDGKLLTTLGKRDWAASTRTGLPFNLPTGVALGPSGDIFVSDGYGNSRIHKFSPEGKLIKSWGEAGKGPGQFCIPHHLAVDRHSTVYVCDRHNHRIQTFTSEGEFITMWTDFNYPEYAYIDQQNDIVYITEGFTEPPNQPRITIRDLSGRILSQWGGKESEGKGVMEDSHGIVIDSHGDIYLSDLHHPQSVMKFMKVS